MSFLENVTDEQRQEMLKQAAIKKQQNKVWAESNLKLDWVDKTHWQELARKYNYRLPVFYHPAKAKFVNRFLKEFGLTKEWYQDHTGFLNGNQEAKSNPTMPAFAQIGFLLEAYDGENHW